MSTKDMNAPAVDQQRLVRLPKWARKHIEELETRVRRAEQTLPWTKPGMEWFTILHPDTRAADDAGKHRKLFMLGEDFAHSVCSVGPLDCVFVGRGKPNKKMMIASAAPELLALAERYEKNIEWTGAPDDFVTELRAAIAKAKGITA